MRIGGLFAGPHFHTDRAASAVGAALKAAAGNRWDLECDGPRAARKISALRFAS
ncbi:hypothetical protein ACWT_0012 [Actinoplanes sp. SE50]|nr:hypothetical protein ACPL_127 [Actinoplanes sp. SE50/110]ATO79427.1 hypothetical protein ACWT_0012 [Actinoplanes sp. SE50]SLL96827.1 hypothetical protein ACSP50_0014 [Actinoplanes sp. SE50/110]